MTVDNCIPGLSVDCVIFGFHESELKVLLLRMKSMETWALPGGFVEFEEDVDQAAIRVLNERTGIDEIFLQQYHFFGNASRYEPGFYSELKENGVLEPKVLEFVNQRFCTVGYYALVEYSKVTPTKDDISDDCEWISLDTLPKMILDHRNIIDKALVNLRLHLNYHPIGMNLLPLKFTMPELQSLYETLLGKQLDRRNFQRKMLGYGILIRLNETRKGGAHKSPYLYTFDAKNYEKALKEGLNAGW